MNEQDFFELRNSANYFLDLHPLHATRFLRFLLGKEEMQPPPDAWWSQSELIVLAHFEAVHLGGLAALGIQSEILDHLQSDFDALVENQAGAAPLHRDSTTHTLRDWLWCAHFGDDFNAASAVAERIYSYANESIDATAITCRIVIAYSEYASRSVLARMPERGISLDESCWEKHGDRCPVHFTQPDNEAYRREQEAACLNAANKLMVRELATWDTAHPVP